MIKRDKKGRFKLGTQSFCYWRGKKMSENHKKKIGRASCLFWSTYDSKKRDKKISQSLKGHKVNETTRKKIGLANKGRILSKEWKNKIKISSLKYP